MAKRAYYYYWSADNVSTPHDGDVYLLAAVSNYTDNDDNTSMKHGFKLGSGYSITIGGEPNMVTTEWNLNQKCLWPKDKDSKEPKEESVISFTGNGVVHFSAQTGAGGAREYDDKNIRLHGETLTTNTTNENSFSEDLWYLLSPYTSSKFSASDLSYNPSDGYPTSGAVADESAITAGSELTIDGSFNGFLEVEARHFSHGGHYSSGTTVTVVNSAISTSTIAAGFRGQSVVITGNFYGSMTIDCRADLASFSSRTVTGNVVGAYAIYSPQSSLKVATGAWGGQIKVSVHSTMVDGRNAYKNDWTSADGSGVVSDNLIQAGTIKAQQIYINSIDWSLNEEHSTGDVKVVDYNVLPDGQSVTVNGKTYDFKESQGIVDINTFEIDYDRGYEIGDSSSGAAAYFTWECSSRGTSVDTYVLSWSYNGKKYSLNLSSSDVTRSSITKYTDPKTGITTYSWTCEFNYTAEFWNKYGKDIFRYTTAADDEAIQESMAVIAKSSSASVSASAISFDSGAQRNTISWERAEKAESGGVILGYTDSDGLQKQMYIDYNLDSQYLTYDEETHRYSYTPSIIDLTSTEASLNRKYDAYQFNECVEVATNSADDCYAFSESYKNASDGSYHFIWYAYSNVITTKNTSFTYKLGEETNTIALNDKDLEKVTIESSDFENTGIAYAEGKETTLRQYTGNLVSEEYLQAKTPLDQHVVVYAEVVDNEMYVDCQGTSATTTVSNNTIQAIGLDADEDVTVNLFTDGTIIEIKTENNYIDYAMSSSGNSINAIGMKGTTINLHDFLGDMNLHFKNNKQNGNGTVSVAGFQTGTFTGSTNLFGNITIDTSENSCTGSPKSSSRGDNLSAPFNIAGYMVSGSMTVEGSLNTNITIEADSNADFACGYLIGNALMSRGFNSIVTINGEETDNKIGIYAQNLKNPDSSLVTIDGKITITGAGYRNIGIAVKDSANLYLTGTIIATGADFSSSTGTYQNYVVKADYGNDVNTGFNSDRVELGAGAIAKGIMDLGGDENSFIINSKAVFEGYIEHDVGTTNLTFVLDGDATDSVIATITSDRDATLSSGATFTVNCNSAEVGTYRLVKYADEIISEADKLWKNSGIITISIQGSFTQLNMENGKTGKRTIRDENGNILVVSAEYVKGEISVTIDQADIVPEQTLYAIGLDSATGDAVISDPSKQSLLDAFKADAGINAENQAKKVLVSTTTDENTQTTTSSISLNWMCAASNFEGNEAHNFELEYKIYDADKTLVSHEVLRLTQKETEKSSNVWADNVQYKIYNYSAVCVPDGGYIDWNVRDYVNSGNITTAKTATVSLGTEKINEQEIVLVQPVTNLTAVNPSNSAVGITDALVKFTWDAAESYYPIDRYDVEFFNSYTPLSAAEQSEIYGAYTDVSKIYTETDKWYESGLYEVCFLNEGEIKIRKKDTPENVFRFYTKQTTSSEILASGMSNHGYVYWRVKATDINGNNSGFVSGIDFRVYADDTTGPTFVKNPELSIGSVTCVKNNTDDITWTLNDITWGNEKATDTGSGVRSYVLQYQDENENWEFLYSFDANEIYDEKGNLIPQSVSGLKSGSYKLRIIARDTAGNTGGASDTLKLNLTDTVAPGTDADTAEEVKLAYYYDNSIFGGYYYGFEWESVVDVATENSQATGVDNYEINFKYTIADGTVNYLKSYTIYGITSDGTEEVIAVVPKENSGKYQITGENLTKYTSYYMAGDEPLMYQTSSGELTGYTYSVSISVSDLAGNTRVLYENNALDIGTKPDIDVPTGKFTKLSVPTVTVTARAAVEEETTTTTTTTDEDGETTTTTTESEEIGRATAADVVVTWSDTYTDDSGVYYLVQFSNKDTFDSDRTYTYLVVSSGDESTVVAQAYAKIALTDQYENLRIFKTAADLTASEKTLTFSNNYPTADSGIFSGMDTVYWKVKALDKSGNLCDTWSPISSFNFKDPERNNATIYTFESPVAAQSLKVEDRVYNESKHLYTGEFKLAWDTVNSGFGIDEYTLNLKNEQGKLIDTYTISTVLMDTSSTGNSTHSAYSFYSKSLTDGKYRFSVTTVGATGLKTTSGNSDVFILDTTAPTAVGTIAATVLDKDAYGQSIVYVSWGKSTDATSGVSHYLVRYRRNGDTNWNEEVVDGSQTVCKLTLTVNSSKNYDFEVIAVDAAGTYDSKAKTYSGGNYSDSTSISCSVVYTDIDEGGDYVYGTKNQAFTGELIGGSDTYDVVQIDSGSGEMRINISNVKTLSGSGNSVTVTLLDNNKNVVKKWTVSTKGDGGTQSGQMIKYLDTVENDVYYVKVTSTNSSTVMQYDFSYEFDAFEYTENNNIAYTASQSITESGTLENIRVGYGEANYYLRFEAENDGRYSFDLSKLYTDTDSLAAASFTLCKIVEGKTALTTIKSFNVSNKQQSNAVNDVLLDSGSYFIKINAPKANSGANVRTNVTVTAKAYSNQDNNDDFFANLPSQYTRTVSKNAVVYLFGNTTGSATNYEWVGYGDTIDFRKLDVTYAGNYTFSISKQESSALTYTIYKKAGDEKTSLTKIKSITVKANEFYKSMKMDLESGEYYVSVSSNNAKKGDSINYTAFIAQNELHSEVAVNGTIGTAAKFEIAGEFYYPVTTVLQEDAQYIGYGGSDAWYNLQINGKATQTLSLTKQSYLDTQSPVTVTFYKTSSDGTKLSAVKSMSIKATQEGGTLQIKNLEAGNYVVRVSATKASSGKSLTYKLELKTSENYESAETAVYNSSSFVGAKEINGEWENDVLYYTESYGANQQLVYYTFNTADYAGEFSIAGNTDFVVYSLKDGTVKLTKQVASSEYKASSYLEANTTYYIAMENTGASDSSHVIQIDRQQTREITDDNDWAELSDDCKIDVSAQEETFGWNSWVGFGDLYSSRMLTIENGGKYKFDLDTDSESKGKMPSVSMTLYKLNSNGTGLSAVKTIKAGQDTTQLLSSGTYYAIVKGSNVKGSVGYSVSVTKEFVAQTPTDNNNAAKATAVEIEKCAIGGTKAGITGWVGYEDEYDYYQLSLDEYSTGFYTFNLSASDATTMTLYAIRESNSALSSLYTYTFKGSSIGRTVASSEVLLDASYNYILMVKSTNASKGGNSEYQFSTNITSQAYQIIDGLKNVTQDERCAVFEITSETAGKYSVSLAASQTLWKINPENGKLSQVKVSSRGVTLSEGKYYIQGMTSQDSNTHCEIVFSAKEKILNTTLVTGSFINVEKGNLARVPRSISEQYSWINLDDESTANYKFTITAEKGGTLQIFVADKNAPDAGMVQVGGDYVLVQNNSGVYTCTVDKQLMDNNSQYLFNFIPNGFVKTYTISQQDVDVKEQYSLLTDTKETYNVYFSIDTAAEYAINLSSQQTLKMYNAETGLLVDLEIMNGSRMLEAGHYYIDSVADQKYLYELDQENHTLSSSILA